MWSTGGPRGRYQAMDGDRIVAKCEACDSEIDVPAGPVGEFFREDFETRHAPHNPKRGDKK